MFTGLVQTTARIIELKKIESSFRLKVNVSHPLEKLSLGESIAVDGCCLTLVAFENLDLEFDVSPETVEKTVFKFYKKNNLVNLERALALQDRLGGHIVQGHVDSIVRLLNIQKLEQEHQTYYQLELSIDSNLEKYIVSKGSITLSGISLTVNAVNAIAPDTFSVLIIPHTWEKTKLHEIKVNDYLNVEVDILAKYVEKLINK